MEPSSTNHVVDLNEFRMRKEQDHVKPLFSPKQIITLEDPKRPGKKIDCYLQVKISVKDKQFLALETVENEEKRELAIVEAIEKNDQLVAVQPIESKEEYEEVVEGMKEALFEQAYTNKKNQ
ncbi:DUF1292 domain-containing protein [Priestia koreensis]|uniref:DUF1292 domain-containing protein n=1 Tax=Priestia koreensis TaxID=284581 RepID=UPI00203BA9CC|nr:DUF1292 domain-containing protein [Priestia koreensis]MCM3006882.1 DUF1292 domain-containing protein [Priestia koreensis]